MELYIFDPTRRLLGVVDDFEYLRWTRRYSACGAFELKAVATDNNLALLKPGHILWKSDDAEAGYIELLELAMDEQESITVAGRFATSLLARRIVWGTEILSGALPDIVGKLLENHLIHPANPARKIDGVSYSGGRCARGNLVQTQVSHKNLLTAVCELCDAADIGIQTVFDPATSRFQITLYQGGDVQGVLTREYENILAQTFTQSAMAYANTALVGGEGEGADRVFVSLGETRGEDRYELFVDAKDLRSEDFPEDYTAALAFRGDTKLAEQAMVAAFEATLNPYGNLRYKTDFDIGSRVCAVSSRWGLSMTARITEITESYDREGVSLDVTLGKQLLTLAQIQEGI